MELIATLSIFAILVAIAAPSLTSFMTNSAKDSALMDLNTALSSARSEAIGRSLPIAVCRLGFDISGDPECASGGSTGNFTEGWLVFTDNGSNEGSFDSADGEIRLRVGDPLGSGLTMTLINASGLAAVDFIRYARDGTLATVSGNQQQRLFTVCDSSGSDSDARGIYVNPTGRAALTSDTDGDGTHNWTASNELSC